MAPSTTLINPQVIKLSNSNHGLAIIPESLGIVIITKGEPGVHKLSYQKGLGKSLSVTWYPIQNKSEGHKGTPKGANDPL